MKKFSFIVAVLTAVMLTGCNKNEPLSPGDGTPLPAPVPQVGEKTETTASISWEAVENAVSYSYFIEGNTDTLSVDGTEILVGNLTASVEYTVSVRAEAAEGSGYVNSEWGSVTFTTEAEEEYQPVAYTVYPMDPMEVMNYANLVISYVRNISPSGSYAVGFDDQFGDPTSFVWERSTGEYTVLSPGEYDGCMAYDVNDNGLIVGAVMSNYEYMPAYMDYKNGGSWTLLPTNGISSAGYPTFAAAVTNSGLIGGQVLTELPDGSDRCVPCVWNNFELDQSMFDLPEDGEDACMYGSYIYSMSEDGRVMTGWQDWGIGSRSPAIWVDGKLTRIYGEEPLIDEDGNVYEGVAWNVSPDGTSVTGYFSLTGSDITGFIYDVASGQKTEIPDMGGVAIDGYGRVYFTGLMGMSSGIYTGGAMQDLSTLWEGLDGSFAMEVSPDTGTDGMLSSAYSVSDDGLVLGGSYTYSAFGSTLQYPVIIVFE